MFACSPRAHPYAHGLPGPSEELPEGEPELLRLQVPERALERGLRRRVSPDTSGHLPEIVRPLDLQAREARQEEFLEDMPCGPRRFVCVGGILPRAALPPPLRALRALDPDQEDAAIATDPEVRHEGRAQGQADLDQLDPRNPHDIFPSSSKTSLTCSHPTFRRKVLVRP